MQSKQRHMVGIQGEGSDAVRTVKGNYFNSYIGNTP